MPRHSLAEYQARKRVEAELELERLRRSTPLVRHVYVPGPPEPCPGPHVGPVLGTLAVVGGVVIAGVLLSAIFHRDP